MKYKVEVNGEEFEVTLLAKERDKLTFKLNGLKYNVSINPLLELSPTHSGQESNSQQRPSTAIGSSVSKLPHLGGEVRSPMPGIVVKIMKSLGEPVSEGEVLFVVEAMKMENNIVSMKSGTLKKVLIKENQEVGAGELLATIETFEVCQNK